MMHDMVLRPQRILSLCSGAGGLDLGVHDALGGCARTVVFVEHEVTACEVLAARIADGALDDAPIWGDLHAFDGRGWRGKVDGVIGGYPCQPFSVAGKRLGTADPRHLWPSIARIIAECEPGWCFFENVGGHLRLGYFDVVRPDLERLGYRVAEGLFSAAEVGAPHQRERLFILAHAGHGERFGAERAGGDSASGAGMEYTARSQRSRGTGSGADSERWAAPGPGAGDSDVADTALGGQRERGEPSGGDGQPDGRDWAMADTSIGQLSEQGRRAEGRDGARPASAVLGNPNDSRAKGLGAHGGGRLIGEAPARATGPDSGLPAFPPGPADHVAWGRILAEHPDLAPAVESPIRRVADGLATGLDLSRTARLRLTGNGVVPAQAALAFRTLWGQLADAGHAEREEWANEG